MLHRQMPGVQGLSGQHRQAEAVPPGWCVAPAILPVTDHRMTQTGEVHPDLMGASGHQLHRQPCVAVIALQDTVTGDGRFAVVPYAHSGPLHGMAPQGAIYGTATEHLSQDDGLITACDLTRLHGLDQGLVAAAGAGDEQQAAGALVQPVHQPGTRHGHKPRIMVEQGVLQGVAGLACPRMHYQSRRFVHHHEGVILVDDIQCHGLRQHSRIRRIRPRCNTQLLPAGQCLAYPAGGMRIDRYLPGADPSLQRGARIVRKQGCQHLVKAQPTAFCRRSGTLGGLVMTGAGGGGDFACGGHFR